MPTCIIDVEQATTDLSTAFTTVRTAMRTCRFTNTSTQKLLCTSTITDIIQFVALGAEFLGGSAQECADHLVQGTLCEDSVTMLIAGLAQVVQAATGISVVCANLTELELERRHHELINGGSLARSDHLAGDELRDGRRLQHRSSAAKAAAAAYTGRPGVALSDLDRLRRKAGAAVASRHSRSGREEDSLQAQLDAEEAEGDSTVSGDSSSVSDRGGISVELENEAVNAALADQLLFETNIQNHFFCFLHVSEAAEDIARALDAVTASMMDCSPVNDINAAGHEACGLDLIGIIEAFTFAANSISRAIFRCPAILNLCADCAAMIINTVSATEALMNAIGGLNLCTKPAETAFVQHETHLLPAPVYVAPPPGEPGPPVEASAFVRDEGVIQLPDRPLAPPPPEFPGQAPPPRPVEQNNAMVDGGGLPAPQAQATEYYGPEP